RLVVRQRGSAAQVFDHDQGVGGCGRRFGAWWGFGCNGFDGWLAGRGVGDRLQAFQMLADPGAIPRSGFPARWAMVAASGGQPVLAGLMLFKQNLRGDTQVAVWVQQLAGFLIAMLLITDVDLCQPGIDLGGSELLQRPFQGGAGGGA